MNCELYSAEAAHCPMRDFYHLFLPSRQALACNWRLMRAANANGLIQSRLVTRLCFISYAATTQIATENRPNATQPNSCVHHSYFIHFHCQRIKTVSLSGQKKYINWVFTCLWYPFYRVPFQVTFLPFQQTFLPCSILSATNKTSMCHRFRCRISPTFLSHWTAVDRWLIFQVNIIWIGNKSSQATSINWYPSE